MNFNTTQKRIQPYDFKVNGDSVTITNTNRQTLKVTYSQIVKQLQRDDIDPHRRVMYESALIAISQAKTTALPAVLCTCLTYIGDNGNCPVHRG